MNSLSIFWYKVQNTMIAGLRLTVENLFNVHGRYIHFASTVFLPKN